MVITSPVPMDINERTKKRKARSPEISTIDDAHGGTYKVRVQNRYETLSDLSDQSDEETESEDDQQLTTKKVPRAKKPVPPPPIVLHDKHEHKSLVKLVQSTTEKDFNIKYTKDGTSVNFINQAERTKFIEKLREMKINFHSYTDKSIKTNAFVLMGLSTETTTDDIARELKGKHHIETIRCAQMRTKGDPLFLVTVSAEHKLDNIKKIIGIDNTVVRGDRYRASKRITQCHTCQMWGHATSNCYAAPKCLKCAENHATHECQKSPNVPAKCVNCGGSHPANATICPTFERRKKWLDERSSPRTKNTRQNQTVPSQRDFPPIRTFAPAPTQNPWTRPQARTATATQAPATPQQHHQQIPSQTQPIQQQQQQTAAAGTGTFQELAAEMRKLNQLINVQEVLQKVRQLNARLAAVTSAADRFQIAVEFFAGLGD